MHAQKAGTQRVVLAFIASFGCTGAALGDQQQNAYVYVDWSFSPSGPATIDSIDQDMWIAMPANGTQWVLTWKWGADPGHGGYLGLKSLPMNFSHRLITKRNSERGKVTR